MKLIVTGDSWTFGSEIRDPRLDFTNRNEWSRDNDRYRKTHIWPNKLAKLLGVDEVTELVNLARASSPNDRIVRQLIDWLMINYPTIKNVGEPFIIEREGGKKSCPNS